MRAVLWYALMCSIGGAALAATASAAYQLLDGNLDLAALAAAALLGAVASGVTGGMLSGLYQRRLRRLRGRAADSTPPYTPLRARISRSRRWVAISPALSQVLRRSVKSLRGRPIAQTLHPEDQAAVEQALQRAHDTGRPQTVRCRLVVALDAPNGAYARTTFRSDTDLLPPLNPASFRHVRLRVAFRPDGQFACRIFDLSPEVDRVRELAQSRREAERARRKLQRVEKDLNRLKQSYHELYHHAPVMYFRLDVAGRLVAFNDLLLRNLGYRREELAQHSYADLLEPGPDGHGALPQRQPPFEVGQGEARWRTRKGGVIDVWIRTVADRDEHGRVVRFRSAALDLTDKVRLNNELRARGDELERTNQRLKAINSELEGFTYVVSHDLKEPLRTLQTYSQRLAEEYSAQLGTDGFQYIHHLIKASQRLGHLIDDLLNLSQAGRMARSAQAFDLFEAVATARQDLTDLLQRKQATVLTEGSLPRVVGDRHRITQLLTNLITNGLKYNQSPQPEVVIAARVQREAGRAPEVVVSVRDNGIGIDPAYHQQIFGMFRRLHQPDEYEGTGAGLAICKRIVEAHGGRIWVESQPGQGATFYFTVPECPAAAGAAAAPAGRLPPPVNGLPRPEPVRPRPGRAAAAPAGPHVVLVEDEEASAGIIQDFGRRSGLAITWFETAEDAWAYLQGHRPALLLFDINLLTSHIDGVELCRRVRTLPALRDTPVALFERDQDPERLAELRAAGADFFLNKDRLLPNYAAWRKQLQEILKQSRVPLPG
jgi:PAS domain S-box-containing protein